MEPTIIQQWRSATSHSCSRAIEKSFNKDLSFVEDSELFFRQRLSIITIGREAERCRAFVWKLCRVHPRRSMRGSSRPNHRFFLFQSRALGSHFSSVHALRFPLFRIRHCDLLPFSVVLGALSLGFLALLVLVLVFFIDTFLNLLVENSVLEQKLQLVEKTSSFPITDLKQDWTLPEKRPIDPTIEATSKIGSTATAATAETGGEPQDDRANLQTKNLVIR